MKIVINKDHGEEWEYQMSLHVNDLVQLEHEHFAGIYRVQILSKTDSKVSVRLHTAATLKNAEEEVRKSIGTLIGAYKMKPLLINSIGKLMND